MPGTDPVPRPPDILRASGPADEPAPERPRDNGGPPPLGRLPFAME